MAHNHEVAGSNPASATKPSGGLLKHWLVLFVLACLCAIPARAGDVRVTCTPPTANVDGSMPADLGGYILSWSTDPTIPAANLHTITLTDPALCRHVVAGLTPGPWYFVMRSIAASDPAVLSQRTAIVSTTVAADPPPCGPAPTNESRPQSCPAPTIGSFTQTRTWTSAPAPTCWVPDPWIPYVAPGGICASPMVPLVTGATTAYEVRGASGNLPLALVGLVPISLPCGPETLLRNGVKYCRVAKTAVDVVVWPADLAVTDLWVRAK